MTQLLLTGFAPTSPERTPGERDPLDRYYTPDALALALAIELRSVPVSGGAYSRVLEPSVGGGSWVRALRRLGHCGHIEGCDLDPAAPGLALCDSASVTDFLDHRPTERPAVIVGNPPYDVVLDHILHALDLATEAVALLLRLSILGSMERYTRLWRTPGTLPLTRLVFLPQRPSFTGDRGTDSVDYVLCIWSVTPPPLARDRLGWLHPETLANAQLWCATGERPAPLRGG